MTRRLVLVVLFTLACTLGAGTPVAAQPLCPRPYCVALPVVHTPLPVHLAGSKLYFTTFGSSVLPLVYGIFANNTTAPLCDVVVDYRIDNENIADAAGTTTLAVVMPDELEWRALSRDVGFGYHLTATVQRWRASPCAYVRLTPIEQRVTPIDWASIHVEGTIRNDTGVTVSQPRIRLRPGHNFSHHYDSELVGVTLAPGETVSYAETLSMYHHMDTITAFKVSAIGLAD